MCVYRYMKTYVYYKNRCFLFIGKHPDPGRLLVDAFKNSVEALPVLVAWFQWFPRAPIGDRLLPSGKLT